MRYHPYMQHSDGPHVWAWLVFVLLVFLLVGLIVLVLVRVSGARPGWASALPPQGRPGVEDPLAVLRLRYARGEVDREAFLQASQDLAGAPPPG